MSAITSVIRAQVPRGVRSAVARQVAARLEFSEYWPTALTAWVPEGLVPLDESKAAEALLRDLRAVQEE